MSRGVRATSGFITSIFQVGVQIGLQAALAPLVLRVAGRETLGAYAAIMQFLSYLTFVDFGFSTSLERFLAQASSQQDGGQRFRSIFTTARTAFLVSNTIFAVLTLVYTTFVGRLFHLSPAVAHQAAKALCIIASWAILRTPLAAYNSALYATQDLAAANLIATFMNAARLLVSLGLVLAGFGLFGLMIAGSLVEGLGSLIYRYRFQKKQPHRMPGWGIPDKPLFREMLSFGTHAMFINVGATLVYSSGNVLAGIVAGAKGASIFYTTQMPTMMGYILALRLSDSALPAVNELWGQNLKDRVTAAFIRIQHLTTMLTLPLAFGVLLFNRDLVTAWVGPAQYGGTVMSFGLALFCLIIGVQHMTNLFSFVFGWVRIVSIAILFEAIANIGFGLLLGHWIGIGGIFYATTIVITPFTIYLLIRLGRELNFNPVTLMLASFGRPLIPGILGACGAMLVHHYLAGGNRFVLLISECVTFVVIYGVGAYFMAMSDQDRQELRRYLTRITDSFSPQVSVTEAK